MARKYTERTWMHQRGEAWCSSSGTGKRVVIRRWLEDGPQGKKGETIVRAIKGDGRTDEFYELAGISLDNPTEAEIDTAVGIARQALTDFG